MGQKIGWAAETPELFSATFGSSWTGLKHYLVVEALPNGGWDWVAWSNDGAGPRLHGNAGTRTDAMDAAERAAVLLARTRQSLQLPVLCPDTRVLN